MTNNKNLRSKLWSCIKFTWYLESVPPHISKLDNNIYIKIFKFIGSFCMFIIISGIGFKLERLPFYIIWLVSILYIIYRLVYTFYVIKQYIYNLCNGTFLVRNSPLDSFSSIIRITLNGLKSVGKVTIGTGVSFALCHELDDLLIKEGKETYFVPGMKKVIASTGLEDQVKNILSRIGIEDKVNKNNPTTLRKIFENLSKEEKAKIEAEYGMKLSEISKLQEDIEKLQAKYNNNSNTTSGQVSELIEKNDPFETKKNK
uniref:hypothetical protein n=1 Tax=Hericium alpestre TaxID=135208 RepID=UPI00243581D1|nr:hypothetical protein QEO35_mgp21 [Hericium alpestre]WEX32012.1 hypothetical protein [Hericium alpestre]